MFMTVISAFLDEPPFLPLPRPFGSGETGRHSEFTQAGRLVNSFEEHMNPVNLQCSSRPALLTFCSFLRRDKETRYRDGRRLDGHIRISECFRHSGRRRENDGSACRDREGKLKARS
jgi:hypothetical protein